MNKIKFTKIELIVFLIVFGILTSSVAIKIKKEIEQINTRTYKIENLSYTKFKKDYTLLMIDKQDTIATIAKDKYGNIWKLKHTTRTDWTVQDKRLLGVVKNKPCSENDISSGI